MGERVGQPLVLLSSNTAAYTAAAAAPVKLQAQSGRTGKQLVMEKKAGGTLGDNCITRQ